MRLRATFFLALVGALLLSACGAASQPPAASPSAPSFAPVTPQPGMGGLAGQVVGTAGLWQDSEITIYAAPYSQNPDGSGFYMLEPSKHPNAQLDAGGYFQMNNIPPGSYVLIVGPEPASGRRVVDNQNQTRVFTILAGKMEQVGPVNVGR